jgi:Icc-related predicted phosphoesterase
MIKIAAASDLHMHWVELPAADLYLFGGDHSYRGTWSELAWWESKLSELKEKRPKSEIIFIDGNHELGSEQNPQLSYEIAGRTGAHYLRNESIELFGIKIFGSPYSQEFNNWAYSYPRDYDYWANRIPDDTDIALIHGPAYGIVDELGENGKALNLGCKSLLKEIFRVKPKLLITGHIHYSGGRHYRHEYADGSSTLFYNVAMVDESYTEVRQPTIIEI